MKPELRIVPLNQIAPHEVPVLVHERELAGALQADSKLRDPLIVHELEPGSYLKLDGTHRHRALIDLGCTHAAVQVVNLKEGGPEMFSVWANLALVEETVFMSVLLTEDLEMRPVAVENVGRSREPRVCTIVCYDSNVAWEVLPGRSLPDTLDRLVAALRASSVGPMDLLRIVPPAKDTHPRTAFERNAETKRTNVMVLYEPIPVTDLQRLVADPIPAGITRTVVWPGRALGLNVPLRLLLSESDDGAQHCWLQDRTVDEPLWLPPGGAVDGRPYDEGIWLFDPNRTVTQPALPLAESAPAEETLYD